MWKKKKVYKMTLHPGVIDIPHTAPNLWELGLYNHNSDCVSHWPSFGTLSHTVERKCTMCSMLYESLITEDLPVKPEGH